MSSNWPVYKMGAGFYMHSASSGNCSIPPWPMFVEINAP